MTASQPNSKASDDDSFEATYAIQMHCDGCTDEIKKCLKGVPGIEKMDFDIKQQIMSVNGTVAPSSIISTLQKCGRDAIIRGTGKPNSSAVSILETHEEIDLTKDTPVRGLVRMVQVADSKTLFDVTINGVPTAGKYYASIHEQGDISQGVKNTGPIWYKFDQPIECNSASDLDPKLFSGQSFLKAPLNVWEIIGRSFVITTEPSHTVNRGGYDICGVIARSAGSWQNDKQVCACSGKTVWQERKDALHNNIK